MCSKWNCSPGPTVTCMRPSRPGATGSSDPGDGHGVSGRCYEPDRRKSRKIEDDRDVGQHAVPMGTPLGTAVSFRGPAQYSLGEQGGPVRCRKSTAARRCRTGTGWDEPGGAHSRGEVVAGRRIVSVPPEPLQNEPGRRSSRHPRSGVLRLSKGCLAAKAEQCPQRGARNAETAAAGCSRWLRSRR